MKILNAYQLSELSELAKIEAQAGAFFYASAMLMQSPQNCPASAIPAAHQTFYQEYMSGWFSKDGKTRFPANSVSSDEGTSQDTIPFVAK